MEITLYFTSKHKTLQTIISGQDISKPKQPLKDFNPETKVKYCHTKNSVSTKKQGPGKTQTALNHGQKKLHNK